MMNVPEGEVIPTLTSRVFLQSQRHARWGGIKYLDGDEDIDDDDGKRVVTSTLKSTITLSVSKMNMVTFHGSDASSPMLLKEGTSGFRGTGSCRRVVVDRAKAAPCKLTYRSQPQFQYWA